MPESRIAGTADGDVGIVRNGGAATSLRLAMRDPAAVFGGALTSLT